MAPVSEPAEPEAPKENNVVEAAEEPEAAAPAEEPAEEPERAEEDERPAALAGAGAGAPEEEDDTAGETGEETPAVEETPGAEGEEEEEGGGRSAKAAARAELKEELREAGFDAREHLNVVFIGHVDAGKSTMAGNILFLLGEVDKRTIDKYTKEAEQKNRESWFLAYIMDVNDEEREKGKTVEVGRAYFTTPSKRFTILDAPGHKSYVPNMIQGAAQADVAVLVLSARRGEFETGFERGGQTREHALLAKTLGVKRLIVVVNKMDEPTVRWSQRRYDECVKKIKPFLKSSGYNLKKSVQFLPVSGALG